MLLYFNAVLSIETQFFENKNMMLIYLGLKSDIVTFVYIIVHFW